MSISVGKYRIDIEHDVAKGNVWNVRVCKKQLFCRELSSDWFLDEHQAETFAGDVAERLRNNSNEDFITDRKPGWTLKPSTS